MATIVTLYVGLSFFDLIKKHMLPINYIEYYFTHKAHYSTKLELIILSKILILIIRQYKSLTEKVTV